MYLVQPFQKILSLIGSVMAKIEEIKSGAVFKKAWEFVTGDDIEKGLINNNKNGDVIVNNIISQDENRNPKVKNEVVRPQERKNNVIPVSY